MTEIAFDAAFAALTGYPPFPWQRELYRRFVASAVPPSCNLPTGLGKTSVIAVWLIALANRKPVPRRLVYVVNRRTVVDQTTDEVEKYLANLAAAGITEPLAISTLRGQFADNREWSADPSRPAVICGTVDMIGSRLLFSGYGCGFKTRPLHAGFLGQDALLVHDEAHLEPAFQALIEAVRDEQKREPAPLGEKMRLKVMELTATSRVGGDEPFTLSDADRRDETIDRRINAAKKLRLHETRDEKKLAEEIADVALAYKGASAGPAVLVFIRKVDDVDKVTKKLPRGAFEQLTGTLRGLERDRLVRKPIFQRFLPESNRAVDVTPAEGTVYLVCTSAGEVGVNISADHLVCDLSTFESMAQRLGRVNRFGTCPGTEVHVVHPKEFDTKDDPVEMARERTLALLQSLPQTEDGGRAASPAALGNLDPTARLAAFAPTPTILPTSDILFDAWALTTVRDKLPGRPPVEPYLHGVTDRDPPETHVAWRREVEELTPGFEDDDTDIVRRKKRKAFEKFAAEVLEDYPVEPLELLREPSYRAFKHLETLAGRDPRRPVWLLDDDGAVQVLTLGDLADKNQKDRIDGMTVLLPPSAGGLSGGRLDGSAPAAGDGSEDVADTWTGPDGEVMRRRAKGEVKVEKGWRLVRSAVLRESEDGEPQDVLRFLVRRAATDEAGAAGQARPYPLDQHNTDAGGIATEMVTRLKLPADEAAAVVAAAGAHDLGKDRDTWQRSIGNGPPKQRLAKSGHRRPPEQVTHYRHEFGSLLDVENYPAFQDLSPEMRKLALHLIAAHHGRGRPHFPTTEAFDPEPKGRDVRGMAASVPQRFARLQRKYGRWGLAYLESLVRAADVLASKKAEGGGA